MTHLLKTPIDLDLDGMPYVGQRSVTWRFDLVDVVTGYRRVVKPVISGSAAIRHDTRSTIKRMISGLMLDRVDTAIFNSLSSRLEPFMIIGEKEFPLGRYVPSDWARFVSTGGTTSSASFYDESFIIDQQLTNAFGAADSGGEMVTTMIQRFMTRFPTVNYFIEGVLPSYTSLGSWGSGTRGGFVLDQLALDGDFLSPWFDNSSTLQFRRTIDDLPSFNFDEGFVDRDSIIESDNLIDAPNRYVVVGNGVNSFAESIVGIADVPSSAPHSIANRGFVVADVQSRQVVNQAQAGAIAANLVRNQTLLEQVELQTPADPRHDGYDVVHWRGENWVEIAWNLPFSAGSSMSHTLRRSYRD